jgi:hypothetical protein
LDISGFIKNYHFCHFKERKIQTNEGNRVPNFGIDGDSTPKKSFFGHLRHIRVFHAPRHGYKMTQINNNDSLN